MLNDNDLIKTQVYNYSSVSIGILCLMLTFETKGKIKLSEDLNDFSFLSVQMNKQIHFNLDHVRRA